jgi:signal transduction histidine kinase
MSSTDHRSSPEWLRLGPIPAVSGGSVDGGGSDVAWAAWDRLRGWDRRYAFVVDAGLAVALLLIGGGLVIFRPGIHNDPGYVFGLTLPLVFRRRAPIAVFAVVAAVAFLQYLLASPLLGDAALLVALYTVASESHWVQVVAASIVLEVGVILATVHWVPTGNHFKSFVFLTGLAFAALLAGVVVRALRRQMGLLAERAQQLERERDQQASLAAAAERARIAREMHDVVSHNIQVMVTLADAAGAASLQDPDRAADAIRDVSGTGRQALMDMRRMLGVLRDDRPDCATAASPDRAALAPQPGLAELEALIERVRSTGLAVSIIITGQPFTLSGAAELTVYRIVQEALTNALKHAADPQSVVVSIAYADPEVSVQVIDDGTRVTATGPVDPSERGHGVTGMVERAAAFGGTLRAGPRRDGGWQVEATLRSCKAPVHA